MKEQVFSSIIALLIFIIGQILKLNNATLAFLFNLVPVIIPTYIMWKNTPRNYLKFITLKRKDITYTYTAKISCCDLSIDDFKSINEYMKNFNDIYKGNNKKVLSCETDDLLYTSIIEVDSTLIKLFYNLESGVLLIDSSDKLLYRVFIERIQLINDALNRALTNHCFSSLLIKLKLDFVNKEEDESRNPFVKKLFCGFNKKIISLNYRAANNSEVRISNHYIEFFSESIQGLNKDIIGELTPFGLFRK